MTELDYKHDLTAAMAGWGWVTQQHEDMIEKFIPDLSFSAHGVSGWIEIKWVNKKPKSLDKIPHYTYGQQDWLIRNGKEGSGHCYLLVGSPTSHYLWRWDKLAGARKLPWDKAAQMAVVVAPGIGHLLQRMMAGVVVRGG